VAAEIGTKGGTKKLVVAWADIAASEARLPPRKQFRRSLEYRRSGRGTRMNDAWEQLGTFPFLDAVSSRPAS
jgi:hypothetical protein